MSSGQHSQGEELLPKRFLISLRGEVRRSLPFLGLRHGLKGATLAWTHVNRVETLESGYYAACAGLRAKSQALEVLANNVANLNSTGYASAHLDKKKIGQLAVAIQTAFQQMGVFPNSPLWGHWKQVDSLRGAVVAVGFQRLRQIVLPGSILNLVPSGAAQINPLVFWEHSLGCALVCRHFARKIDFNNPEKGVSGCFFMTWAAL